MNDGEPWNIFKGQSKRTQNALAKAFLKQAKLDNAHGMPYAELRIKAWEHAISIMKKGRRNV